jgi:hypothetical protein
VSEPWLKNGLRACGGTCHVLVRHIPLGLAGIPHIVPICVAIIALLAIVFSYLQTIDAYPHGGGSYTASHVSHVCRFQEKLKSREGVRK